MASANSTLRLVVDSKEYDATLKNAQKGLTALEASLRNAGKSFNDTDAKVMKYVSSIGTMNASATTVRGKVGEMTSAFINLSQVYNQMSADVKSGDIGKALAASMETLKQRTLAAKEELRGLESQLSTTTDIKMPSVDGGAMSGAFSDFTKQFTMGNVYAMAIQEGISALQSFASEMKETVRQGIEMAKAGEGIRNAFERLNRPDLLDNLKEATHGTVSELELMKQAVKFNDFNLNLDEMGTLLAFAQQKAKDTGQSVDYMVDSIVTGLGRQSKLILDNLGISAAEITSEMKKTGDMTTAVANIIKRQMGEAGEYIETAADRAARQQAELADKSEELGRRLLEADEAAERFNATLKIGTMQVLAETYEGLQALGDAADDFITPLIKSFKDLGLPIETVKGLVHALGTELENTEIVGVSALGAIKTAAAGLVSPLMGAVTYLREFGKQANRVQNIANTVTDFKDKFYGAVKNMMTPHVAPPTTDDSKNKNKNKNKGKTTTKPKTEYELNEEAIKKLANEYAKLASSEDKLTSQEEERMAAIRAQISILQERNQAYKEFVDIAQGKDVKKFEDGEVGKLEEELSNMRKALSHASSTDEFKDIQEDIDILTIKIKQLKGEYETIFEKGSFSDILKATKDLEKLAKVENTIGADGNVVVNGKQNTGVNAAFDKAKLSDANIKGFISAIKQQLDSEDIGGVVYERLTERLKDATLMQSVIKGMIAGGVKGADFSDIANDIKKKLSKGGDISDEDWQAFLDRINEKINSAGLKLKIEVDSDGKIKGITTESEAMTKSWQKAAQSIGQVSGALNQIEDPAAKIIGTIGQAVATIALSYAKAVKDAEELGGPWAWIAFAAAGLATMISTISAIHSATGYAQGGIIKGTSYSGDNIGGLVDGSQLVGLNAGEVVLNHAQTETLANSLENDQQGGTTSVPYVMGEQVFLGVNTYLRRTGRGELVTTKTR